jgi:hypothetical protein
MADGDVNLRQPIGIFFAVAKIIYKALLTISTHGQIVLPSSTVNTGDDSETGGLATLLWELSDFNSPSFKDLIIINFRIRMDNEFRQTNVYSDFLNASSYIRPRIGCWRIVRRVPLNFVCTWQDLGQTGNTDIIIML